MQLQVTFDYIYCCAIRCPTSDIKDVSVNFINAPVKVANKTHNALFNRLSIQNLVFSILVLL